MPLNPTERHLGKKPGVVHDPRTFRLVDYLAVGAPNYPAESYVGKGEPIRWYANNRYGDCTVAAQGHRVDVQERAAGQVEIQLTDKDILEVYAAVTGFNPATGANDNGAYMLDILNHLRRVGLGRESDGTSHRIGAYAKLDMPLSRSQFKLGCWMFGGVYLGAWLPADAERQIDSGERWSLTLGPGSEPGGWGGHTMTAVGYSAGSMVLATWGTRQRANWDWLEEYVDEAYVVVSEDWLRGSGKSPRGLDVAGLNRALAAL